MLITYVALGFSKVKKVFPVWYKFQIKSKQTDVKDFFFGKCRRGFGLVVIDAKILQLVSSYLVAMWQLFKTWLIFREICKDIVKIAVSIIKFVYSDLEGSLGDFCHIKIEIINSSVISLRLKEHTWYP